jgi:AmmeMemoRadiSam system protein B
MLTSAYITPHPPVLIPEIGGRDLGSIEKTVSAMQELGTEMEQLKPETVLIISPHGIFEDDIFGLYDFPTYQGDLGSFGAYSIKLRFSQDKELVEEIRSNLANLAVINPELYSELTPEQNLDHGMMVPLYYLSEGYNKFKLVPITFSLLDLQSHYELGQALGKIIKASKKKIAFVASGDLSHRLTEDAPVGFSPKGAEFDQKLIELIENNKVAEILSLDPNLIAEAGECGLRSIVVLLGLLSNFNYRFEKLSYEGPFGVGYLVGKFIINS